MCLRGYYNVVHIRHLLSRELTSAEDKLPAKTLLTGT